MLHHPSFQILFWTILTPNDQYLKAGFIQLATNPALPLRTRLLNGPGTQDHVPLTFTATRGSLGPGNI